MPNFKGSETASEILNIVLSEYELSRTSISYQNEIPYLEIRLEKPTEMVARYRVDTILLPLFADCEVLFNHYRDVGYFREEHRPDLLPTMVYGAMSNLLNLLVLHHGEMFDEVFYATQFLTETVVLQSFTKVHSTPQNLEQVSETLSVAVRDQLDKTIDVIAKNRRGLIAEFLDTLPLLSVPTGVGRPKGKKKPQSKRQEEAAQFEKDVEVTIRTLYLAEGKLPTRIRVAEKLRIGGDGTRGSAFYNKLKRHGIDYEAIQARVKLHA